MNGLTDLWTPADRRELRAVLKGTDSFSLCLLENVCSFSSPSPGAIHKTRNAINREVRGYTRPLPKIHMGQKTHSEFNSSFYGPAERGWQASGGWSGAGVVRAPPAVRTAGVLKQQQLVVLRVEHLRRDGRDPATLSTQQPRAGQGPPPC